MDDQIDKKPSDEECAAIGAAFGVTSLDGQRSPYEQRIYDHVILLGEVLKTEEGISLKKDFLAGRLTKEDYKNRIYSLVVAAKTQR